MYYDLKQRVCESNLALVRAGLVVLTWGNVSGADRSQGVMAIKPSGVPYDTLTPDDIVVLSLADGKVLEGTHRPSSDTPTHLYLYQHFDAVNGISHTHSTHGTAFAQANREIPCFGTTHADNFYGPIPVTRQMHPEEVTTDYELNTGKVIVERFTSAHLNPADIPGILVAGHAPFAWGKTVEKSVENATVLEFSAQMALHTLALKPNAGPLPQYLLDKHFLRKNGKSAYYGQPNK
jgi:L-ribulose-5-phosphate 4-epimerase